MYRIKIVGGPKGSESNVARNRLAVALHPMLNDRAAESVQGEDVEIITRKMLKTVYNYLTERGYKVQVSEILRRRVLADEILLW